MKHTAHLEASLASTPTGIGDVDDDEGALDSMIHRLSQKYASRSSAIDGPEPKPEPESVPKIKSVV